MNAISIRLHLDNVVTIIFYYNNCSNKYLLLNLQKL